MQRKHPIWTLAVLVSLLFSAIALGQSEDIELDANYHLRIETTSDHHVSATLYYGGTQPENVVERYMYANGVIGDGAIARLELDGSNDTAECLVIISDRTSTYGARYGIIFWKRGGWRSVKVPHEIFSIEATGRSNLIRINGRLYRFRDGFFQNVA